MKRRLREPWRCGAAIASARPAIDPGVAIASPSRAAAGRKRLHVLEIFVQVPGQGVARIEHRQHVQQAEHLHLHRLVAHGPGHDPIVPPAALENARLPVGEVIEDVPADLVSRTFDCGQILVGPLSNQRRHSTGRVERAGHLHKRLSLESYVIGHKLRQMRKCRGLISPIHVGQPSAWTSACIAAAHP